MQRVKSSLSLRLWPCVADCVDARGVHRKVASHDSGLAAASALQNVPLRHLRHSQGARMLGDLQRGSEAQPARYAYEVAPPRPAHSAHSAHSVSQHQQHAGLLRITNSLPGSHLSLPL